MLLHKIFIILNSARNSVHFMAIKRHYTLTSMVIPGEPAAVAVRSGYQTWLEWITMHRVVVAYIPLVKTTTTPTPPLMFVCVLFLSVCMCVCVYFYFGWRCTETKNVHYSFFVTENLRLCLVCVFNALLYTAIYSILYTTLPYVLP